MTSEVTQKLISEAQAYNVFESFLSAQLGALQSVPSQLPAFSARTTAPFLIISRQLPTLAMPNISVVIHLSTAVLLPVFLATFSTISEITHCCSSCRAYVECMHLPKEVNSVDALCCGIFNLCAPSLTSLSRSPTTRNKLACTYNQWMSDTETLHVLYASHFLGIILRSLHLRGQHKIESRMSAIIPKFCLTVSLCCEQTSLHLTETLL